MGCEAEVETRTQAARCPGPTAATSRNSGSIVRQRSSAVHGQRGGSDSPKARGRAVDTTVARIVSGASPTASAGAWRCCESVDASDRTFRATACRSAAIPQISQRANAPDRVKPMNDHVQAGDGVRAVFREHADDGRAHQTTEHDQSDGEAGSRHGRCGTQGRRGRDSATAPRGRPWRVCSSTSRA